MRCAYTHNSSAATCAVSTGRESSSTRTACANTSTRSSERFGCAKSTTCGSSSQVRTNDAPFAHKMLNAPPLVPVDEGHKQRLKKLERDLSNGRSLERALRKRQSTLASPSSGRVPAVTQLKSGSQRRAASPAPRKSRDPGRRTKRVEVLAHEVQPFHEERKRQRLVVERAEQKRRQEEALEDQAEGEMWCSWISQHVRLAETQDRDEEDADGTPEDGVSTNDVGSVECEGQDEGEGEGEGEGVCDLYATAKDALVDTIMETRTDQEGGCAQGDATALAHDNEYEATSLVHQREEQMQEAGDSATPFPVVVDSEDPAGAHKSKGESGDQIYSVTHTVLDAGQLGSPERQTYLVYGALLVLLHSLPSPSDQLLDGRMIVQCEQEAVPAVIPAEEPLAEETKELFDESSWSAAGTTVVDPLGSQAEGDLRFMEGEPDVPVSDQSSDGHEHRPGFEGSEASEDADTKKPGATGTQILHQVSRLVRPRTISRLR
ncbi:hypothetical protein BV20DRAFT_712750 [Pilatotrama ljubarskyi]|nr:hypothetical protein BV20DRAFT_712750 [Pilatotrama ljubarskyi]